ncbi:MAG TPA: FHA domain-containing protein [Capillimicrobium sp.]|jgi:predicted  nucleic acid-binding Zn-ribbon protein
MSGTLAGTGSFRCAQCGYVVTLAAEDPLPQCPGCHGASFERASLFGASADGRFMRQPAASRSGSDRDAWIARAREAAPGAGEYLAHDADGELQLLPLKREWTRVGRSLAADVRFDDPTVSRRHALLVRQADGVRVLDDRSLNGVFVNGERVDWRALADGDEIVVGRYRLTYIEVAPVAARAAEAAAEA